MAGSSKQAQWLDYHFGEATMRQRQNTFRSLLSGKFNLRWPSPSPWMLQVEVTNRCNLNCTFCSRYSVPMKLGDMAPGVMNAVVDLSAQVQEVALFGYGEPLISKAFYQLLPRLRSARVGFFTNGLLLDERLLRKILDLSARPLSYIVFSVDGATRETYEAIRLGSDFHRVWRNLENAAHLREREPGLGHPALRLEFVAMRRNAGELARMVRQADDAGVDELKVSHLVVWNQSLRDESLFYHPDLCRQSFQEAEAAAADRGIKLSLPKIFGGSPRPETRIYPPCRYPWHFAMISFEGEVRGCCFAPNLIMGNLKKDSFQKIWRNERYANLRLRVNTPECSLPCRRCEERFRNQAAPDEELTYIKLTPRQK